MRWGLQYRAVKHADKDQLRWTNWAFQDLVTPYKACIAQ